MPQKKFDVAVVGAGIAGLTCANYLARGGKRVILLEQNDQAGGCMSGFWKEGYYFDSGNQSFESMGIVFPILKELGIYDLHQWQKVSYRAKSPFFDLIINSLEDTQDKFSTAFPDEPGIKVLFGEVKRVSRFLTELGDPWHLPMLEKPNLRNVLRFLKWLPDLQRWMDPEFKKRIFARIQRDDLRNWFTNVGYYQMPFFFFAISWHWWVYDYWYPAGGILNLMNSLVEKLQGLGGETRFQTPVKKILVQDGRAAGILTGEGEKIAADYVVYAGDYKRLIFEVLGEKYFEPDFVEKVRLSKVSEALVSVYLGLNLPPEELKKIMLARHVVSCPDLKVIIPNQDSELKIHQKAWMELTSPAPENPALSPPGKSTLILQTFSSAEWQNFWGNRDENRARTPEYRELKKAVGMELIKNAEAMIPGISEKIEFQDVETPVSAIRHAMNTGGASAGWTYNLKYLPLASKFGFVSFRTPVPRLYTAGHYTMWPGGVPNAALSGKIVAGFILKKPVLGRLDTMLGLAQRFRKNSLVRVFRG